jgi:diguanylate cyclase (GGDEF)-like protein
MASIVPIPHGRTAREDGDGARRALELARSTFMEDPTGALAATIRCQEAGRALGDASLRSRAGCLQAAVSLHRGDLHGALALALEAERAAEGLDDPATVAELSAVKAQLRFFTGAHAEALRHAEQAIRAADESGSSALRLFARRATCLVFGNLGVRDWPDRLAELLALAIEIGARWEEAISRNDLACLHAERGDVAAAEAEIDRALEVARGLAPHNRFALGVIHSTRGDVMLAAGRPEEALADAERSLALLVAIGDPNPYVLGATVRVEVQALMSLGRFDDAQRSGEGALTGLGDRLPQTRSLILAAVADAMRDAGRLEEAYDALARSAALERQALRELYEVQLGLERATLEANALAAANRRLREQADRDFLTGLHNRRFLARELERRTHDGLDGAFSLAVLDLDHFKSVNDRHGHDVGDQVLVRAAALLRDMLRSSDLVVRSGGEEFIVLMPGTDACAAAACGERIRNAVRDEPWERLAPGLRATVSVGVATTAEPADLEALIKLADERLYEAKRGGRDCVVREPRG